MHIICMTPLAEGVYNDHKADHIIVPPEGWAYIPEEFPLPATFPRLGSLEAEERAYGEEGGTVLTVTTMTEGTLSEPEEVAPSQLDRIEAQVAFTAMMTDTLLEV